METLHSFERGYLEISKVTLLEFYFTTLRVRIAFLSRLGCLESFSDHMHLLFGFSENIWSEYFAFSGLGPIQWGSTFSTIQSFKWGHLQAGLIAIVVRKFCEGQTIFPLGSIR